jgi:hypothetical protein
VVDSTVKIDDSYKKYKNSSIVNQNQSMSGERESSVSDRASTSKLDDDDRVVKYMSTIPKEEEEFNKRGISIYDRRKDSITWNFMYEDPST